MDNTVESQERNGSDDGYGHEQHGTSDFAMPDRSQTFPVASNGSSSEQLDVRHKKQISLDSPAPTSPTIDRPQKKRPSGQSRMCGKCGQPLLGQFVRALGNTYHLECFTCAVSSCYTECDSLY